VEIVDELAAIERRMKEIASAPVRWEFGKLVDASLERSRASRGETERLVRNDAREYRVDPALVEAIIENESGFDPNATSSAGARGLMQLMPATAAGLGVRDSYDAAQNVRAGTRYLRGLIDRFGDIELAVAAYNAGAGAVERFGGIPPYAQTQNYVRNVLAAYRRRSQVGNLTTNDGS
jgi:soluble lytic murein transglycosylase-like protein